MVLCFFICWFCAFTLMVLCFFICWFCAFTLMVLCFFIFDPGPPLRFFAAQCFMLCWSCTLFFVKFCTLKVCYYVCTSPVIVYFSGTRSFWNTRRKSLFSWI